MKKKILSVFLTAAMLASLASCGGGEQQTTAATSAPTTAAPANEETTTAASEAEQETEPAASVSCKELTEGAVSAVEEMTVWLWPVDDAEAEEGSIQMITDVMGYDTSLFSEYAVVRHAMSVHLVEIVIVKPAAGKAAEVKTMLENRKEQIKSDVAFYPEQQENAEKTIVGSLNNDEIIYLLCGSNPPEMEKKMLAAANG